VSQDIRGGAYIEIAGEVNDLTGTDRALKVSFTLPVGLKGWKWENTAATARRVEAGKVYPSVSETQSAVDGSSFQTPMSPLPGRRRPPW
jgi:hypothetical protein